MEVRPGYKQTEVGAIPDDWAVDSVGSVASITTGDKNTQDRVDDGAYPFFVRSSTIERINSFSFDGEGALTAGDGVGTGKIFHYIKGKFDFHQRVYLISNFSVRLDGYFFFLYFSNNFYSRIMQMTAKSSVDSVRREMIADMRIPLPSPGEQRAIAAALSDVDALLAKLDQLIAKKRDLKQAAMQQLLTGQTRLPGFSRDGEAKRLGDLVDVDPKNLASNTPPNYAFNYISLEDVESGVLRNYSEQLFRTAPSRARRKLRKGDILISTVRPNLKSHLLFNMAIPHWVCSTGFSVVRCREGVTHPGYVFFHFFADGISRQIEALLTGSSYPAINSGDVRSLQVPFPDYAEQTAIATVLSDMDAEIAALEARRDKTRVLKQGMMQELLTGRIRLVQPETKPEVAMPAHEQLRKAANDGRNWAFNEAVIISVLAENFADASHPLGRMRYTKLSYLLHRYANEDTEGYLKKAAGPYNPATRYKGPERIAQTSGYVKAAKAGNLHGFVAGEQAYKARTYFDKWYGPTALEWLRQFRYEKNEALELLTTVDKAVEELRSAGKEVTVQSVKEVFLGEPEWKPKLERPMFSDEHIQAAILRCQKLFGAG